jgi:cobalt-zinc-cadmium efflux system protein
MSAHQYSSSRTLFWALIITLCFAVVEAFGGWLSDSLALMSDAGHMLTDASALGLAAFAAWLAQRPPSKQHTYGLARAEVLAALINGFFMLAIVAGIVYAAINRFNSPHDIDAVIVMIIALIGLLVNIAVAWVLHRGEQTLNTRAAFLHVMGDLLGSLAALISGIVIYFTDWIIIDPILSLLICTLILFSSLRLLREAVHVIMEGVPQNLDAPEVGYAMISVEGIESIHDLHIWTVSSGSIALSAHVVVDDIQHWQPILARLQKILHDRFEIDHTTIQPEPSSHVIKSLAEANDHGPEWHGE